jgi:small subunit ribosomal protein S14|tara:strand:- start:8 stop:304 length:297 start_codon:yes stop_codon:yes gene_type:complete
MNTLIIKDKKKRKLFKKKEKKNIVLKSLYYNEYLNKSLRLKAKYSLQKTNSLFSKVSIRNNCVITGRKNFIYKKYKLSRIQLKKLILNGDIPGFVKSN